MSCFFFIRHGETDETGRVLSGRSPGIHLNERGRAQAASLPERLQGLQLDMICSSPLERCQETAQPLAEAMGLETRIIPDLLELDYGHWRGKPPAELDGDAYWGHYNQFRSVSRIPAGELLVEAQLRMLHALESLQQEAPGAKLALVGHSDPIKSILAYLMGLPLDFVNRLCIAPASVSVATLGYGEPRVHCINHGGRMEASALFG